ncbi:MAG: DinB family protein [Phycisphaerae bacterium]|nr:DinB family protein [Gemmatimonadaceae bacterium]
MSEPSTTPPSRATAVWQRGPTPGYVPEMQPAVHALLDVIEEVALEATHLTHAQLWARPSGVASVGFHLVHLAGSTDRLFTYALGHALSDTQREFLRNEPNVLDESITAATLVARTAASIRESLAQLVLITPASYQEVRYVGRARLESTVWGLLFHAAEHASRHAGQLVTTSRIVQSVLGPV